ncbi:hypothetical protein [Streptomyces anulatus]|uniref:hypothetical protein n=1 Tax=Streptomyces anulatus TaxID=1892 RepID=UPI003438ED98
MMIDDLIERLRLLPGAQIGCGPRHKITPQTEQATTISEFLESHTFMRQDHGYVDFLERFSGVIVDNPEEDIGIDIMGFDPRVANLAETEGPLVDSNGYALIAMCSYGEVRSGKLVTWEYDFAFDATGLRKRGIYRLTALGGEVVKGFEWHVRSFEEWLAELVERSGQYERPT